MPKLGTLEKVSLCVNSEMKIAAKSTDLSRGTHKCLGKKGLKKLTKKGARLKGKTLIQRKIPLEKPLPG